MERAVPIVELQFTNLAGELKSIDVTYERYKDALKFGKGVDGSSVDMAPLEKSDLVLKPIPETYFAVPWDKRRVARVLCDVFKPAEEVPQFGHEEEYELGSRYILKRGLEHAKKEGYDFVTSAEMEFFALKDGVAVDRGIYFAPPPYDRGAELRRRIMTTIMSVGVQGESLHHEVATSQYEITLGHDKALRTADNVIAFKYIAKNVASTAGASITFMAKPFAGMNGSGMHLHMCLRRGKANAFYGREMLSKLAKHFVAGILRHAKALSALAAPTVNSYKRLVAGFEAPVYICWGFMNRSAMIRVPSFSSEKSARVEIRIPDPMCNPYLAQAAVLASGLDGINERMDPGSPMASNAYHSKEDLDKLPATLKEALGHLTNDRVIKKALGERAAGTYVETKMRECEEYNKVNPSWDPATITRWETERYLERF
jgi:glutamine synthetase